MPGQGIFEKTLKEIKAAKSERERGGVVNIPFGLPTLDKYIPGIMPGLQYIVTASSGVGKTQLTKFLFVTQPYKFIKEHPELGLKLKIMYFALEESKEEFMYGLICHRLKEVYNITTTTIQLMGINHTLDDNVVAKIEECREYFAELEKSIEVIDYVANPFGIYSTVRNYARNHGTFTQKEIISKEIGPDGNIVEKKVLIDDEYTPNDPKELVVVVADHIGLVEPEKTHKGLHEAMTDLSANWGRKHITKRFKYCLAVVQQQAADTEKQQYTMNGQSIEAKLEPSLNGLGDNKLTQRDAYIVIGLFAPDRYKIDKHFGYDVALLKDNYRCLSILKNRLGIPNLKLPLFFNGAANTFRELPKIGSNELGAMYEAIKNHQRNTV